MPKISVIIPVYNVERYIEECLRSVCNQTLKDIEILCINDGSTDNSLEILKSFAQNDNRVIIIDQQNAGVSAARNKGLELSKGEYISFVDSDDYIKPDFLEKLYNKATETEADIVACGVTYLENGNFNAQNHLHKQTFKTGKDIITTINDKFSFMSSVVIWNKLYSANLIKKHNIKFVENCRFEDNHFTFITIAIANKIALEPSTEYIYRIINNSFMSDIFNSKKLFDIIKIMDNLKLDIQEKIKTQEMPEIFEKIYNAYVIGIFYSWNKNISKNYIKEYQSEIIKRVEGITISNNEFIDKKTKKRYNKLINLNKPLWKKLFNIK